MVDGLSNNTFYGSKIDADVPQEKKLRPSIGTG
jgi:hypothetical protein